MKLTETAIRNARPRERPVKLFDGRGLYLLVQPSGARWWRLKYAFAGREKLLSLGVYPDVSLKQARERRDEARRMIAEGTDPSVKRQAEKLARADTFKAVALEWLELQRKKLAPSTFEKKQAFLEQLVFPWLGASPIGSIAPPEVLAALKRIEARGRHETAHRTRALCGQVFRFAVATGRAERDPTADLRGALAPAVVRNHAAITDPARVGQLLIDIADYPGQPATRAALQLAPLVFVRPGELRQAEWREFDLEGAEWRIPGARMKMGELHLVPLARQAVAVLRDLEPVTGAGRYVFPSLRSPLRPLSENTVNAALRTLGYSKDEMTGHGFRAMASTLLNELGWDPDVIELQLAHAERDKVRAAYNRAQRLDDRRRMMQAWADHLDALRAAAESRRNNVVPIRRKA